MSAIILTLDVNVDEGEELATVLNELVDQTGITWEIANAHGPAGGCPVIRFTAPDAMQAELLAWRYMAGDDQADEVRHMVSAAIPA